MSFLLPLVFQPCTAEHGGISECLSVIPGSGSSGKHPCIMVEVKCERLQDVVGNDSYSVNNYLDNKYRPRPTNKIVNLAKKKIGETWQYNLLISNCEHFATEMRYGCPKSKQVRLLWGDSFWSSVNGKMWGSRWQISAEPS